jgi:hypothetical protein
MSILVDLKGAAVKINEFETTLEVELWEGIDCIHVKFGRSDTQDIWRRWFDFIVHGCGGHWFEY